MLQVTSLKEEHLEDAAGLVSNRYRRLCEQEPHLPHHYAEVNNLLPLLREILSASGIGVAAIRGDRLVGFLYVAHYISLFPNDGNALRAWHWMGFGMISVDANCYLIETDAGYVLIDTGGSNSRKELVRELESAGCKPGLLKLIVLTHGDFDHTGNAAYLRHAFGGKIAMHRDDLGMVERGDMFVNRKKPNILIRRMLPIFSGFGRSERFAPDLLVEDGDDLSEYGIDASVISIPGHSKGSIGILTAGSDLFCGDLLVNTDKPVPNSLDDRRSSCARSPSGSVTGAWQVKSRQT